jgi:RimJ/RimL family protein N-acetyltransferase
MADEGKTIPPGEGSAGQAFLIGPTLYLRPVTLTDAATAPIWRVSIFPAPVEVVEDELKKALEVEPDDEEINQLMLICRRSDDRPVGSVRMRYYAHRIGELRFVTDRTRSDENQEAIIAEVMRFTVPFLIDERHLMAVVIERPEGEPLVEEAARELGMRLAIRFREMLQIRGERRNRIAYELLNPRWVEKLGMPRGIEEGPADRLVASPAPLNRPSLNGDAPKEAMVVGERLYLRPFKPEEAEQVSRWMLQDTEIYFPQGRWTPNPVSYGYVHKKIAKSKPPEWLRFAIVLRENDELIGANGLAALDWRHMTGETESEIFKPEYRSKGYGTEAKHLLLEYAFQVLNLHMVFSWVSEANPRSAAAIRKQGYRDCGYLAWEDFHKDGLVGAWLFDLLATEWRAARR